MEEEKTLKDLRQEVSEIEKDLQKRLSTLCNTYKLNNMDIEVNLTSFERNVIGGSYSLFTLVDSVKLNVSI